MESGKHPPPKGVFFANRSLMTAKESASTACSLLSPSCALPASCQHSVPQNPWIPCQREGKQVVIDSSEAGIVSIAKSGIMVSLYALPVGIMGQGSVPGHIRKGSGGIRKVGGQTQTRMTPNVLVAGFSADSGLA